MSKLARKNFPNSDQLRSRRCALPSESESCNKKKTGSSGATSLWTSMRMSAARPRISLLVESYKIIYDWNLNEVIRSGSPARSVRHSMAGSGSRNDPISN